MGHGSLSPGAECGDEGARRRVCRLAGNGDCSAAGRGAGYDEISGGVGCGHGAMVGLRLLCGRVSGFILRRHNGRNERKEEG